VALAAGDGLTDPAVLTAIAPPPQAEERDRGCGDDDCTDVPAIDIHSREPRASAESPHPLIGSNWADDTDLLRTAPRSFGPQCEVLRDGYAQRTVSAEGQPSAGQGRAGAAGRGPIRNGGPCGGGTTNRGGAGAKVWIAAGVAAGAPTGAGAGISEAGRWLSITAPTTTPPIVQAT
jgi:hypothetical protein